MARSDVRAQAISRRAALRLLGGLGVATLTACGGATTPTPVRQSPTAPATTSSSTAAAVTTTASSAAPANSGPSSSTSSATTSAAPAAPTAKSASTPTAAPATRPAGTPTTIFPALLTSGRVTIYNYGAKLPTDKITMSWIDYGQLVGFFWKEFFPVYQQAHPNITVKYDNVPFTQVQEVIPVAIQNGNPQNVFRIPPNIPIAQAVQQKWVIPLDDIVPHFADWQTTFPPGSFLNGINQFDGKTYSFPLVSNRLAAVLFYNVDLLQRAGYDPQATPFTWDTFRAAAKKITDQGKGQVYGLMLPGKETIRFSEFVSNIGQIAGRPGGGDFINWKTGEFQFTADEFLGAIDLLLALKADGSILPGALSLATADVTGRMPTGVNGLAILSSATVREFADAEQKGNFKFDLTQFPLPTSGPTGTQIVKPGGSYYLVTAATPAPQRAIVGDCFAHIGSLTGMTEYQIITGGGIPVVFAQANQAPGLDPRTIRASGIFERSVRIGPEPTVRNPDVAQVQLEQKAMHPDFGETVQGIFSGQIKDAKSALKDVQDRTEAELNRAIKAAQAKGAKVSRDDWKFPNWDPTRDYTQQDYDQLKG
jgi:multiple sugar transport system substrate-binding protein